ncbi:MAG: glycosyltransferase family 2 protein [Deltaproteobacteria bacterium]|nr:glycosyltransferase family 2 protein [Deltaproteobacteria bacterium]
MKNIWAIIPAYNEALTLETLLQEIKKMIPNIVVVSDGSTDATVEIAKKAGVTVLNHIIKLGKGAALKTGCEYAIRQGATHLVTLDGDAQHNPKEIPRFIENLKKYDVVFGSRRLNYPMPLLLYRIRNDYKSKKK